jgi:DNA polymerase
MFVTEPVGLDSLERDERSLSPEEQLLEKIVTSGLKFELSQCYVTPIVKCPLPDPERGSLQTLKSCAQITLREIDLASPGLVLALGLWPSQALSGNFSPLGLLKSKRQTVGAAKIALRMNYGLADLVRMPELKRDFWNDLKSYRAEGLF